MKRFVLVVLAILVAACAGSAGAYFTGQAEVADNIIRAGGVAVSCEPTSAAICVDSIAPGTMSERSFTVVNSGALPASFVVTGAKKAGITDFYKRTDVPGCGRRRRRVRRPDQRAAYRAVRAGSGRPGAAHVQPRASASAGNDLSGDYVKMSFYVDAEQVH